jgi:hypothetical protein
MSKQLGHGLLFFRGDVRTCVGYVYRGVVRLHSDGLGVLPVDFFVTFDGFATVGKCRLDWRYRDEIGAVFERWIDEPVEELL